MKRTELVFMFIFLLLAGVLMFVAEESSNVGVKAATMNQPAYSEDGKLPLLAATGGLRGGLDSRLGNRFLLQLMG
jgi:hypothetical protein